MYKRQGKALPFVGKAIPNLDKYISFVLFTVFLPLLLYGLALAYYLPAIPFIRWVSALVGWIILVVEALVAAPLWLCAHALPEGDGAAGPVSYTHLTTVGGELYGNRPSRDFGSPAPDRCQ